MKIIGEISQFFNPLIAKRKTFLAAGPPPRPTPRPGEWLTRPPNPCISEALRGLGRCRKVRRAGAWHWLWPLAGAWAICRVCPAPGAPSWWACPCGGCLATWVPGATAWPGWFSWEPASGPRTGPGPAFGGAGPVAAEHARHQLVSRPPEDDRLREPRCDHGHGDRVALRRLRRVGREKTLVVGYAFNVVS